LASLQQREAESAIIQEVKQAAQAMAIIMKKSIIEISFHPTPEFTH
jgi:hypothetical protein